MKVKLSKKASTNNFNIAKITSRRTVRSNFLSDLLKQSVATLLETGRRMERLFLKVRERNIAIHPMTQILEEPSTRAKIDRSIGISEHIQFILRTGYLKNYPQPVSLRRPIVGVASLKENQFIQTS